MENLNQRIAKIIEYSKLTASEFADAVNVQRSSVSHITSGRNKPSLEFIMKIKNRYPELNWDWLIFGEGDMTDSKQNSDLPPEAPKTSLPDLFSMISDEDFGKTENKTKVTEDNSREPHKAAAHHETNKISDSQRLEQRENLSMKQPIDNQADKIKKIVMFYDNGKFESFEP